MTTVTKMRLSKETISVLKNFASINSNILIKPGNVLKTRSSGSNLYAESKIQEDFDVEVPIWDLNKFLGVISMFVNPDLEFGDKYVDISNGKSSVRYFYSPPSLLTVPTKDIKFPKSIASFVLDEKDLNEMIKASSILQVSNLKIIGENGKLLINVDEAGNTSSNNFSLLIDENYSGPDYEGKLNISDLKLMPGSYTVTPTDTIIAKFSHESNSLFYYIAVDRS